MLYIDTVDHTIIIYVYYHYYYYYYYLYYRCAVSDFEISEDFQTLVQTDVQTPFLGTPLVPLFNNKGALWRFEAQPRRLRWPRRWPRSTRTPTTAPSRTGSA